MVYIAGDALRHQPMGAGHVTVPVTWAYGIPYPALVLYIAGDALCHQPMGAGHMPVPVMWAYGDSVSCNGVTQC